MRQVDAELDLEGLNEIPVEEVADRLDLRRNEEGIFCLWHDNQGGPSLQLNRFLNQAVCFQCDAEKSVLELVMKAERLNVTEATRWLLDFVNEELKKIGLEGTEGAVQKYGAPRVLLAARALAALLAPLDEPENKAEWMNLALRGKHDARRILWWAGDARNRELSNDEVRTIIERERASGLFGE